VTVYQESQAFDRKTTAQAWLKRRETELAEPDAIARADLVRQLIERLIEHFQVLDKEVEGLESRIKA
jgi:hypothetical protein